MQTSWISIHKYIILWIHTEILDFIIDPHRNPGFYNINTMDSYRNPVFHYINTMDPHRNPGFHYINTMDPYRNPVRLQKYPE